MRRIREVLVASYLVLFSPSAALHGQVPDFSQLSGREAFAAMAEYLSRDGGRWRADNPNHDGTASTPPAFGLWFAQELRGRVLTLQIVVHYPNRVVVSSTGRWAWHPATDQLSYEMVDRAGGLTEGLTAFPESAVFRTVATRYADGSPPTRHRDDNLLVSGDVHRNETFEDTEEGWVSRGVYEWIRTR